MLKSARRHFGEQTAYVAEMMFRRCVRHARAARALAECETVQAAVVENAFGGGQQRFLQVAVVVLGFCFHVRILREFILTVET